MPWFTSKLRRVAALLAVSLAVLACASGPARNLIPLSPAVARPPGAPTLLIRLDTGTDDRGVNRHVADYLSDGTVTRVSEVGLYCSSVDACGTLESNRLTATGLAALRVLLTEDGDLLAQPRVLTKAEHGRANIVNTFVMEQADGSRYAVNMPSNKSRNGPNWDIDLAERLDTLAGALIDPLTLLGPSGLASPVWEVYRPARLAVFIRLTPIAPKPTAQTGNDGYVSNPFSGPEYPDLRKTGWPFEGDPDSFGTAFTGPDGGSRRCAFVASGELESFMSSLPRSQMAVFAAGQLAGGQTWSSGGMTWGDDRSILFGIVALLPEDAGASCEDALFY